MSESGMHGMLPASQKVLERGRCYRESELRKCYCHNVCLCVWGGGVRGQGERERREVRGRRIRGKKGKEKEWFRTEPHSMSSSGYEVVWLVCWFVLGHAVTVSSRVIWRFREKLCYRSIVGRINMCSLNLAHCGGWDQCGQSVIWFESTM